MKNTTHGSIEHSDDILNTISKLAQRAADLYFPRTERHHAAQEAIYKALAQHNLNALVSAMDRAARPDIATEYWRCEWLTALSHIRW